MEALKERFLAGTNGDALQAACVFAYGLMQGDPASFKAGYTLANAAIAAAEVFDVEREAVEARLAA